MLLCAVSSRDGGLPPQHATVGTPSKDRTLDIKTESESDGLNALVSMMRRSELVSGEQRLSEKAGK